jgi:phosphoglycerate kinase
MNTLSTLSLFNKKVILRLDLNVPLDLDGNVIDTSRVQFCIPTIIHLLESKCKLIILSHLGRPSGKDTFFSLSKVLPILQQYIQEEITFLDDCIGQKTSDSIKAMKAGDIVLLENVRFYKEEEENDQAFAKQLHHNADVFVNDAFGCIHREHASTVGITKYIDYCCAGFLLEKEFYYFHSILEKPSKPFAAIIGGAKVSTKLTMIKTFLNKVDILVISGAMVFTFLDAFGLNVGNSLVEKGQKQNVIEIQQLAKEKDVELVFPTDFVITDNITTPTEKKIVPNHAIPNGWIGADHGPITNMILREKLKGCQTIFWNGPMGVYEHKWFDTGTKFVAHLLSDLKKKQGIVTIVGGGDSIAVLRKYKLYDTITHVSSGGGAFMRLFESTPIPAVELLSSRK